MMTPNYRITDNIVGQRIGQQVRLCLSAALPHGVKSCCVGARRPCFRAAGIQRRGAYTPSGFPILIGFVRAHAQVSFSWRMSLQLRREPLKPLKSLLRTTTPALFFDVRAQFTPSQTNSATHKSPTTRKGTI